MILFFQPVLLQIPLNDIKDLNLIIMIKFSFLKSRNVQSIRLYVYLIIILTKKEIRGFQDE